MAGFAYRHGGLSTPGPAPTRLASGQRPAFWTALVTQGLHAVHLPEAVGGQGGALAEAACVIDAAGYGLLPGPLLPTVIAGAVAATADPIRRGRCWPIYRRRPDGGTAAAPR